MGELAEYVYEILDAERGDIVGIPEEYVDYTRYWLSYEMSNENFQTMLDQLAPFAKQATLVEARNEFGINTKTQKRNQNRRESLVKAGVYPSELLREVLTKDELKAIIDEYRLDAHKQKTDEMIEKTIASFTVSEDDFDACLR